MKKYTGYFHIIPVFILAVLLLIHCKKKNKFYDGFVLQPGIFTHPFMNNDDYKGFVPLGNLSPPAHTFPTDHMYPYVVNPLVKYPIFCPGKMKLVRVKKYVFPTRVEYTLDMSPGGNYHFIYAHVGDLEPGLLAAVGAVNSNCQSYTAGGFVYTFCEKVVNINVTAGQQLGTTVGVAGQNGLDVGLIKEGNGGQNEALCPVDYCTPELKARLEARLSNADGTVSRTISPICGEVNQNKPGTLQGIWFKKGLSKYPEDPHIAFVHDNINPLKPAISVGISQTGLPSNVYTFTIAASGTINRDFKDVVPGAVYCFQNLNGTAGAHLIVEFVNADEIKVEAKAGNTCVGGETFTANAVLYTRGS
jgi:hypothetical protein